MAPRKASGFKVKSFASARLSVRAYLLNVNTHPRYKALRKQRADLRAVGRQPSGTDLAPYLLAYSKLGSTYTARVKSTILTNNLGFFDHVSIDSN